MSDNLNAEIAQWLKAIMKGGEGSGIRGHTTAESSAPRQVDIGRYVGRDTSQDARDALGVAKEARQAIEHGDDASLDHAYDMHQAAAERHREIADDDTVSPEVAQAHQEAAEAHSSVVFSLKGMPAEASQEELKDLSQQALEASQKADKLSSASVSKGMGESLADVIRHDKDHDDWHRSHGDAPCTSEADCAAKRAKYAEVKAEVAKGDVTGHPFHGNQYTEGSGGSDSLANRAREIHDTVSDWSGTANAVEHNRIAAGHTALAEKLRRDGRDEAANAHEEAARQHNLASAAHSRLGVIENRGRARSNGLTMSKARREAGNATSAAFLASARAMTLTRRINNTGVGSFGLPSGNVEKAGDVQGHEFHGNQYSQGGGSSAPARQADPARYQAQGRWGTPDTPAQASPAQTGWAKALLAASNPTREKSLDVVDAHRQAANEAIKSRDNEPDPYKKDQLNRLALAHIKAQNDWQKIADGTSRDTPNSVRSSQSAYNHEGNQWVQQKPTEPYSGHHVEPESGSKKDAQEGQSPFSGNGWPKPDTPTPAPTPNPYKEHQTGEPETGKKPFGGNEYHPLTPTPNPYKVGDNEYHQPTSVREQMYRRFVDNPRYNDTTYEQ
jgi:hypothetical protein